MEAKIIFKNGAEITAEMNGNSLILMDEPVFPSDLSVVTVRTADGDTVFRNAVIQACASVDGRFWFTFVEETDYERTIREIREQNDMLIECILEMSEVVYAE